MAKKTNKTSHVLNLITGGSGGPGTRCSPDAGSHADGTKCRSGRPGRGGEDRGRISADSFKEMGGDMPAPEQAAPAPEEESQETESVREGTEADQAAIHDPATGPGGSRIQ